MNTRLRHLLPALLLLSAPAGFASHRAPAQDRLPSMPGYARFQEMRAQTPGAVVQGALSVSWAPDGGSFEYAWEGKLWRYDVARREAVLLSEARPPPSRPLRAGAPARGRQYEFAFSPDSTLRAFHRDRDLYLAAPDGSGEVALTTAGEEGDRVKYGTASWVYGEELNQNTAMWWSPSGSKLAYYRFDEGPVPDYYLAMDQTRVQSSLDVEAYPKAGAPNPVVDLFVYDLATRRSIRVDIRDGLPFTDEVVGHYGYRVGWTPDGSELTLHRTNRRQNVLELAACDPDTGSCRVIVREEWPQSWVMNHPPMQYLSGGRRFLWIRSAPGGGTSTSTT